MVAKIEDNRACECSKLEQNVPARFCCHAKVAATIESKGQGTRPIWPSDSANLAEAF